MNKLLIETGKLGEFFDALKAMRGIQELDLYLVNLLDKMNGGISKETQKFLCLAFSLFDDGNTRVSLTPAVFKEWWSRKWNGLVLLQRSLAEADGTSPATDSGVASAEDFDKLIDLGIKEILEGKLAKVIGVADPSKKEEEFSFPLLMEVGEKPYLYLDKHYWAKLEIESAMQTLFGKKIGGGKTEGSLFLPGNPAEERNLEQEEAVRRGLSENLIVTGGPGTGKTTVVLYILWNLLNQKEPDLLDYDIYLAAPSGKAADRMLESLKGNLKRLAGREDVQKSERFKKIYDKLNNLESSTIHRLLKFSRGKSDFSYNKGNQFSAKSIFVIDEASMIDINLFASLLQAIPPEARLFILGDPYQLPSVDAGAVLGELLNAKSNENFRVNLIKSHRFDEKSEIGQLAIAIKVAAEKAQNDDEKFILPELLESKAKSFGLHPALSQKSPQDDIAGEYVSEDGVFYYQLEGTEEKEEACLEKVLKKWLKEKAEIGENDLLSLYELPELVNEIKCGDSVDKEETKRRDRIWNLSLTRRILSAERRGFRGVEWLNKKICALIKDGYKDDKKGNLVRGSRYFPGQLLIITKNQEMYKLYNGDTGIVVFDGNIPHLMLKKAPLQVPSANGDEESVTPTRDDYEFCQLSCIPEDAVESAFAITIHKSQGSEYDHVAMFLPKQVGHPLLNNQIVYTGVTRAKRSVTMIATPETLRAACETITKRDTGIEI